ncbi:putative thiamine transporter SLC35F3-like protein [Dinothrombium tinctorium]|uniref:Putative thiamine transporter SLC35F3-like protein n=1 Tax=Dinothrombium tinctorium TaxID=1965070 RepID=A0A3S3RNB1_9ACAR|nr:putative thiamine transporter SLC35F3-like protein [Dinothrombium tinctorium]RWS03509.1 putative thiamine transporter SLC35F3-like protein [Dinothrombium tinctorium]RWS03572.1 putative thiamine transporter SLC35F3-like protein [Dinothrombium tinctorium]
MEKGFTALQFFTRCGSFCVLWVFANYLLIHTLRKLDTTVVLTLFACTISFVYLLSWVVLHQQFVGIRIVAVIICATGIALLAYMDGVNSKTLASVILTTGAATFTAIYKVFYKRTIGYTTFAQTALFFTLVGFLNAFLMWPMVLLLYFTGVETLSWNHIPWLTLSGAATLNLTANLLGNFGVTWTYEIFLTLGLFVAIPISAVIDASVYDVQFKQMKLGGILLIMFGFLVVLLPDNWNQYLADILRSRLAKWKRHEQMKKNGSRVQDTTTAQLSRLRTPSGRVK